MDWDKIPDKIKKGYKSPKEGAIAY